MAFSPTQTNDRFYTAGTIATVCVKIVGEDGTSTGWNSLDYFFKNDFQKGSVETYTVHNNDDEVGKPALLHFSMYIVVLNIRIRFFTIRMAISLNDSFLICTLWFLI